MMTGSSRRNLLFSDESNIKGHKFGKLKQGSKDDIDARLSTVAPDHSPYEASLSPSSKSPWSSHMSNAAPSFSNHDDRNGTFCDVLIGSLTREEGHIYSLAANKDFLYTGSDSKNIRVWKNQQEFSGFKANSGLVKSIVIAGEKILTGHQDGRIRVWKVSAKNDHQHKRIATLPTLKNYIKCSMKPSNYVEVRRHRNVLWIKHYDAISCLALTPDLSYIYSASWDRTFKVWRGSDFKCLESVNAHDDAVNALVVGPDGLVYTGSADGTVKVWRREVQGKGTKHFFTKNLLKQECAVTALAMNQEASYLYCGSSDGLVNYWEQEKTAIEGGVLKGHKLAVLCLATAGSMVFSGSADMGICVWKRTLKDAHICMSVLTSHTGPVKCLAVERDHETSLNDRKWILYSGSLDKSVKVWRVSEHPSGHVHSQHVQPPRRSCEVFSRVSSMRRTGSKMH